MGEPYKPKWGLDFAGQPSFGVGVDPFGTYATGGVSFLFSDMLGNHVIGTAAQVTQPLRRVRRNALLPEPDAPLELGRVARPDALRLARVRGRVRRQHVRRRASTATSSATSPRTGFVTYPFSRSYRVEFSGGYRRIGQSYDLTDADLLRGDRPAADRGRDRALRSVPDRSTSARRAPRSSTTRRSPARPARFAAAATAWSSRRARARSSIRACSPTCGPI